MQKKKKRLIGWKVIIPGLPIAAAAGSTLLPLTRVGQQMMMLVVLLWIQAFFILECFMSKK